MKISDRKVSLDIEGVMPGCISSAEEMLLFDIETTGLKKEYCRVYLIGCAYLDTDGWHIRQWLAQSPSDEKSVLLSFAAFTEGFDTLVTFNGDKFDIPFVDYKNGYYGIETDLKALNSLDIYRKIKPAKKIIGCRSFSQKAVEELLGIKRDDKYDGGRLIPYYYEYELSGSAENERLLLLHNFEDVLGMGKILPALSYCDIVNGDFEFSEYDISKDRIDIKFTLRHTLPASFKNEKISGYKNVLCVSYDIKDGYVYIPLDDYKNYYYLPDENIVIHKDLAAFVDRKYKKKATKDTCFLKVEAGKIQDMNRDDFKSFALNMINIYR